jgi:hypothetical protein
MQVRNKQVKEDASLIEQRYENLKTNMVLSTLAYSSQYMQN